MLHCYFVSYCTLCLKINATHHEWHASIILIQVDWSLDVEHSVVRRKAYVLYLCNLT
jgi:hypothetical protein